MIARRSLALAGLLGLLGLVVLVAAPAFFELGHLRGLALDRLPVLVAALGMTCVVLAGRIDLAIGAELAALSALLGTLAKLGVPPLAGAGVSVLAGIAFGLVHGALVAWLRAPALLVTLATLALLREGLRLGFGGAWILGLPPDFPWLGLGQECGTWTYLAVAAVLTVATAALLHTTRIGRALWAIGGDEAVARALGVDVARASAAAFAVLGASLGIAAVLHATRYPTIETEVGLGFELEVIACVVVGGAHPSGGRASVLGTFLGWLLFAGLGSVLVFLRIDPAWEKALAGLALVLGVAADTLFASRRRGHA